MKKILALAISALFATAAPAFAEDSGIHFYGVLDAGLGYQTNAYGVDPNLMAGMNPTVVGKANNSVFGMFNGGISDSRVGVKGSEDLGDGKKIIFTLETGFNLPTGTINNNNLSVATNSSGSPVTSNADSSLSGQLFNRQAWLAVSDETYGTVALGRSYNFIYDVLSVYDPVKYAQMFSPLSFSGSFGGGAGVSEDTRIDDNIKWTAKFGNVNVGLAYKVGGVSGNNAVNAGEQVNVGYDDGVFGVQVLWEQHNDAIKPGSPASVLPTVSTACTSVTATATCATTAQLKATAYNTSDVTLAFKYKVGEAGKISVGYEQYTLSKPSNPTEDALVTNLYGLTATVTPYTGSDQNITIYFGGGTYNVSEKTDLSLGYYSINYASYDATPSGTATAYSLLLDHTITKSTDSYIGAMFYNVSGDLFKSYISNSNATYGVGVRYKF